MRAVRRSASPVTSAPVTTRRFGRLRAGRRKAFAVVQRMPSALVDLEVAGTLVVAVVEVVAAGNADLLGGVAKRLEDVPAQALPRDLPLAAGAVQVGVAAEAVLGAAEVGKHVLPAPAGIAELAPVVVVGRLAAHVDHAVDRRAATEHLAARIAERPAVETGLGLGRASSSRCAGCPCSRGSRPGCGSTDSWPVRRPRAAAPALRGSALRRLASTQPAVPPPTMT